MNTTKIPADYFPKHFRFFIPTNSNRPHTTIIDGSVYDHPKLYDTLFAVEWKKEIEFLNACFQRHRSVAASRIFEPACGTGRLLWRLAKQGFEVAGLDLNPHSVAFCNRRLRKHGLPETAFVGDMTDFRLEKPVDAAFNLVSSFLHLTTESLAGEHLRRMAAALRPKGLYLLGFHLVPKGKASCSREAWKTSRGSLTVQSMLRQTSVDFAERLARIEFRIQATTPTKIYELIDTFPMRTYTAAQFHQLLTDIALFDVLETFDFGLDDPIQVDETTEDVVFVLQKR